MQQGRSLHTLIKTLIVAWVVGALFLFAVLPGVTPLADIAAHRLLVVVMAVIIVGGATGCGARLFRALVPDASSGERVVFGAGIGLGILSLLILLLGHIGIPLLKPLFVACGVSIFLFRKEFGTSLDLPRDGLSRFVLALIVVFFLLSLTLCFLPPCDYDVLEYHLGAPAEYVKTGQIHFLPHNMYASFPANMEMLYLLALSIGDFPFTGASVAKVINLLMITLAAAAVYCLGRKFVNGRTGLLAAAALYVHPLATSVGADPYVEGGLMLYTVLALHGAVSCVCTGRLRWAAVSGIAAGLAMGCKYTGAVFVAIPVIMLLVLATRDRKGLARAGLALGLCAAVFLPWAVKNTVNTGNPVFPLGYRVFGARHWSAEHDARFVAAHRPPALATEGISAIRTFTNRLLDFLASRRAGSPFLLVFVPLCLVLARQRAAAIAAGFFLLCYAIWFFTTHRIDRFLMPALPTLCLLAGMGADRAASKSVIMRYAAGTCLAIAATLTAATEHIPLGSLGVAVGLQTQQEWLERISRRTTYSTEAVDYMNDLDPGSQILLIGEAQIYYLEHLVVYAVVFSDDHIERLLAGGVRSAIERMKENGITHVFVNWFEFQRLRGNYAYTYKGTKRPGYLPNMTVMDVAEIVGGATLEASWGPEPPKKWLPPKHRSWELYRLPSDTP